METKTETKTPLAELAERLTSAQTGQDDQWLAYYRGWNRKFKDDGVVPNSTDPKDIQTNEYLYRVHMGLLVYDQGAHPLFKQLSEVEQEALDILRRGILRLVKNQKEAGLYDKFYQRVAATK